MKNTRTRRRTLRMPMKVAVFATILFQILSAGVHANDSTDSSSVASNSAGPTLATDATCEEGSYSGILELSYTYSLETGPSYKVETVIQYLEEAILRKLADPLLSCKDVKIGRRNTESRDFGITRIKSDPVDQPSTLSTCATVVSDDNICTVVHGSVTLFINKQSSGDLAFARYAARSTIEESMSEGFYESPVVEGIEMVTYRGPLFTIPVFEDDDGNMINEFSQTNVDSSVTEPSGMTRMEIVVVATLVSAVIGIAGAMLLSKRVLIPGQNCLAACDGTGIDVKYMNDIKKDGHGHAGAANCTGSSTGNSIIDEASEMQWNSNTGLSVIEESSDAPSYFTRDSYATSSTPFSRRTGGSDDNSVHSEKTFKISNKFRTPSFGNDVIREDGADLQPGLLTNGMYAV